jgi:hypothetical protein
LDKGKGHTISLTTVGRKSRESGGATQFRYSGRAQGKGMGYGTRGAGHNTKNPLLGGVGVGF